MVVVVVVGEPQQFSMFGRKMPCAWKETITPLKYADAGLNNLIGLSIIDILLASPKGIDPYVDNQKFTTTFLSQCDGHIYCTSHICVDNDILTLMELTQMSKVASKLLEF